MISGFRIAFLVMLILSQNCVHAFAPQKLRSTLFRPKTTTRNAIIGNKHMNSVLSLPALGDSLVMLRESSGDGEPSIGLGQSDQGVLGAIGAVAALIVLFSEYTLKTTGCGLPAGPLGLVGLVEGLSYLSVVGIGSFSLCIKVKTGSGLPAGPAGLLGAAEGLSFLAILLGLVVLTFQVTDFGYIPNAVPMEGGMCS